MLDIKQKKHFALNYAFIENIPESLHLPNASKAIIADINIAAELIKKLCVDQAMDIYSYYSCLQYNNTTTTIDTLGNKALFVKQLGKYIETIKECIANKGMPICYIALHGHGVKGFCTKAFPNGDYRIKIDNILDQEQNNYITFGEIFEYLLPLLIHCEIHIILNTCNADTAYVSTGNFNTNNYTHVIKTYASTNLASSIYTKQQLKKLHIYGMSANANLIGVNGSLGIEKLSDILQRKELTIENIFYCLADAFFQSHPNVISPNAITIC